MRLDAGAILGWKFHNAEGIKTVDGWIVEWPSKELGEKPSPQQIEVWGKEYDAAMLAAKKAAAAKTQGFIDAAQAADSIPKLKAVVVDMINLMKENGKV